MKWSSKFPIEFTFAYLICLAGSPTSFAAGCFQRFTSVFVHAIVAATAKRFQLVLELKTHSYNCTV